MSEIIVRPGTVIGYIPLKVVCLGAYMKISRFCIASKSNVVQPFQNAL